MLIVPNNKQLKRILDLLSEDSLSLFEKKLENLGGLLKTPFNIDINGFTFTCSFISSDLVLFMAFRYKKNSFNFGEKSGISEINIIENNFLDRNREI